MSNELKQEIGLTEDVAHWFQKATHAELQLMLAAKRAVDKSNTKDKPSTACRAVRALLKTFRERTTPKLLRKIERQIEQLEKKK